MARSVSLARGGCGGWCRLDVLGVGLPRGLEVGADNHRVGIRRLGDRIWVREDDVKLSSAHV